MAGDPDYANLLAILEGLPLPVPIMIELGMCFTDPMADGPAIQAAGLRRSKRADLAADAGDGARVPQDDGHAHRS